MSRRLTAIIPTYNRAGTLGVTVEKLFKNIVFDGEFSILVGDDSSEKQHYNQYESLRRTTIIEGPHRGFGANVNMLLDRVDTDIVIQLDDDHWLDKPLDVNQYYDDLFNNDLNIGWIRLFMGERQDYYNLSTYYKFTAASHGPYWFISPDSPELYIASNRPHIKRIGFHREYGMYDANKKLGPTEESWCHNYKTVRRKTPWRMKHWVVVPMFGLLYDQWSHQVDVASWQKAGL